jgi:ABC-type ATPase with predicted acetyltransferase domain
LSRSIRVVRESQVPRSGRVMQVESMFDVPAAEKTRVEWSLEVDLAFDWNVGLIVGPSGAGKTTLARELFGDAVGRAYQWRDDRSLLDDFPAELSIKDVVGLMTSVGFSSPPSWMRAFAVLSNGEQFRAGAARAIAEAQPGQAVVLDEFTSVVDRQVAKVASHAIQKTVRRRGGKFVAVSCHEDVTEWLQPDWILTPEDNGFARRSPQGHPPLGSRSSKVRATTGRAFGGIII